MFKDAFKNNRCAARMAKPGQPAQGKEPHE
jgi:hypothetical protein